MSARLVDAEAEERDFVNRLARWLADVAERRATMAAVANHDGTTAE